MNFGDQSTAGQTPAGAPLASAEGEADALSPHQHQKEWEFVALYLTLCRKDARPRIYASHGVQYALCWMVRAGAPWRILPNDSPPRELVYQQTMRWVAAG